MITYRVPSLRNKICLSEQKFDNDDVSISIGVAKNYDDSSIPIALMTFHNLNFEFLGDGEFLKLAENLISMPNADSLRLAWEYVLKNIDAMLIFEIVAAAKLIGFGCGEAHRIRLIKEALAVENFEV